MMGDKTMTEDERRRPALKDLSYLQEYNGSEPFVFVSYAHEEKVMVMDGTFSYDADGVLQGEELAPQLLYQGTTRAREELALIVVEDEGLFRRVVSVIGE